MRNFLIFLFLGFVITGIQAQADFKQKQLSYQRVRDAHRDLYDSLTILLSEFQVKADELEIFIQVFKQEKVLEIWIRNIENKSFKRLRSYQICRSSGELGPKRMQGDLQVPEGFYHISVFNPWSNFHLSLGINYPNASDRILGVSGKLGGDIYIHGSCVTIGCIPLTDERIKEVYLLCLEARNNGQLQIPITIYPARLESQQYNILKADYADNQDILNLWSDLKTAYDYFILNSKVAEIVFLGDGRHRIK